MNPAFDAALLQRGLRAMDVALGQGYDATNHICIPQGGTYATQFPAEGIDFAKYQGGFEGLKGVWKTWIYEDGGKGSLKSTVHEMVEETAVESFSIVEKVDKDKNGILTQAEWDKFQKGKKAEDQRFDLEYLIALDNVSTKMIALEKNTPLNPTDPESYPEVIALKEERTALAKELATQKEEVSFYQHISMGLGGGLALTALLLGIAVLRRKSSPKPAPEKKAEEKAAETPKPETSAPQIEAVVDQGLDAILNALNAATPEQNAPGASAEASSAAAPKKPVTPPPLPKT